MTNEKKGNSKISKYAKAIQDKARQIKKQHPTIKHIEAIKLASQKLKQEGFFK